jgi:predicted MFS family arabinose efflux permease
VPPDTRTNNSVRALAVLVCLNVLNFYDRHLTGALAEPIREEFALTDTQLGLMSSAFVWIYAIVGMPLGRIADSWSRKKMLAGGLAIWSMLTGLLAFVTSYGGLVATRLGVGIGEAVAAPASTSLIGDLFPPEQRSRALGMYMIGLPIGAALSYFVSSSMAQAFGWRTAVIAAAVPGLLLVPALLRIAEPIRGATEKDGGATEHHRVSQLLRIPTLWWIIASGALLNFNMYALGVFCPAFLSRVHRLSLRDSGIATGIIYAIGGVCGGLFAGRMGDRVAARRENGRMQLAAMLTLIAVPAAWFGIQMSRGSLIPAIALLAVAYAALSTYFALVYSSIQDIVAPSARGITMAIYFMAMYLCGASFGPLLTGSLSDRMAQSAATAAGSATVTETFRAIGLQQAMLVSPVLSLALACVLYAGSRTIVADIRRRQAQAAAAQMA